MRKIKYEKGNNSKQFVVVRIRLTKRKVHTDINLLIVKVKYFEKPSDFVAVDRVIEPPKQFHYVQINNLHILIE